MTEVWRTKLKKFQLRLCSNFSLLGHYFSAGFNKLPRPSQGFFRQTASDAQSPNQSLQDTSDCERHVHFCTFNFHSSSNIHFRLHVTKRRKKKKQFSGVKWSYDQEMVMSISVLSNVSTKVHANCRVKKRVPSLSFQMTVPNRFSVLKSRDLHNQDHGIKERGCR